MTPTLQANFSDQQLSLGNQQFGIRLNLGEALLAQVLLNQALQNQTQTKENTDSEEVNQKLIQGFCQNLITSLSLINNRLSQLAINELELSFQACLLKKLDKLTEVEFLLDKLSTRRLSQAKEEASYLNSNLKAEEEIRQFLLPAYNQLTDFLKENNLNWPDPEGRYF